MAAYWDTSAVLSLLFEEKMAPVVRDFARNAKGLPGYTSFLTFIEMESAFSRRRADGSISTDILPELRARCLELESSFSVIWPDSSMVASAKRIIGEFGLKPGDSIQLASAIVLLTRDSAAKFACLDRRLNGAAIASGFSLPWEM